MTQLCVAALTIMMAVGLISSARIGAADQVPSRIEDGSETSSFVPGQTQSGADPQSKEPKVSVSTGERTERTDGRIHSFYAVAKQDYINGFPEEFYEDCPEQGTVSVVYAEDENGNRCASPICVYTPCGYEDSADMRCNVVFLLSGSGGTMYNWLVDKLDNMTGNRLFDWLISTRRARPFIAVSVNMDSYDGVHYSRAEYHDLAERIERYDLPYIVRTYRTYAASADASDLAAAKEHFMIVGVSQGAICLSDVALDPNHYLGKCFGNIVLMSNYVSGGTVSQRFGDSDSKLFFADGGRADSNRGGSPHDIMNGYKRFDNLKTAKYFEFESGHRWYTWFRGIAAVLQIAMK